MTLTLLALAITPMYLSAVLDPKRSHKLYVKLLSTDELRYLLAFFMILFALVILSFTGLDFKFEWESLLTWIGLLVGLKGIFLMLFPTVVTKTIKKFKAEHFPVLGFFGLLFVLFLVYVDTQLIA